MFTVHLISNDTAAYAADVVHVPTMGAARDALRDFVRGVGAYSHSESPAGIADVYPYSPQDDTTACYGDYPLARFTTSPRGGIRREYV